MAEKLPDGMPVGRGSGEGTFVDDTCRPEALFVFDLLSVFLSIIFILHVCHLTGFRFAHVPQLPVSPLVPLPELPRLSLRRLFLWMVQGEVPAGRPANSLCLSLHSSLRFPYTLSIHQGPSC